MKNYYRVMLGKGSTHAAACLQGNFIGTDFGITQDLSTKLTDQWKAFNNEFVPVYLAAHPDKSKIAAGLSCGSLWTVSNGIKKGDIVLCPDGSGSYKVGEVTGDYYHAPGEILPHRRTVQWFKQTIDKTAMSDALKHSAGSIGTVSDISSYRDELEKLIGDTPVAPIVATDPTIEDPATFALEKHLEDFLVQNWAGTDLGKDYDIFTDDGEVVGQQFPTDTGSIDILAIKKDKKELLVVELKRGRASDVVVGQILRYMGYVTEELAEEGQVVKGAIIALEDDPRLKWALVAVPSVVFYKYQISFKLVKS